MCMYSMIHDYGRGINPDQWTIPAVEDYRKLLEKASDFDKLVGEPDCADPEKVEFQKRLDKIEKKLRKQAKKLKKAKKKAKAAA